MHLKCNSQKQCLIRLEISKKFFQTFLQELWRKMNTRTLGSLTHEGITFKYKINYSQCLLWADISLKILKMLRFHNVISRQPRHKKLLYANSNRISCNGLSRCDPVQFISLSLEKRVLQHEVVSLWSIYSLPYSFEWRKQRPRSPGAAGN